ncbi:hypothetical protein JJB09_15110 [Rhizobium sp. KVB221]|uniref:Transporter n=1 Tax=Rhizobium setariae TaxID=2801340 RepID=A0A936YUD6_9HYPH|nr:hypothetical protein [Rhizobium setariae]
MNRNGTCAQELPSNNASSHEAVNEANNPLTPKITINFQDYFVPSMHGIPDKSANQFLFRGLIPADLFGAPQLFRFTLPVATSPEFPHGSVTGLGDLTLMDLFVFPKVGDVTFAGGPLLVVPTATDDALGAGKWQAGASGVVMAPQSWGILGGLFTYQTSFAGDDDREDVSLATVQPIVNFNLSDGFYLRSTAVWNFNLENGNHFIPVGLGLGKVIPVNDKITMNAFIEPQYTIVNEGAGNPRWQIFGGLNFQFALGQ